MMKAISAMHGPLVKVDTKGPRKKNEYVEDTTMVPLSLPELGAALRRVCVMAPFEHRALYDLLSDPSTHISGVTLSELLVGLAVVSPSTILEELRDLLMSRATAETSTFAQQCQKFLFGDEESGVDDDDGAGDDDNDEVDIATFQQRLINTLHMTPVEAAKLARLIDVDDGGSVSTFELEGALEMAAPALPVEDSRVKMLQSIKSLEQVLGDALGDRQLGAALNNSTKFGTREFIEFLEPLENALSNSEKQKLAEFVLATNPQGCTLCEFLKGLRLLAPGACLQGLKLQLLQRHEDLSNVFSFVQSKRAPVRKEALGKVLRQAHIEIDEKELTHVFDLLDVRNAGLVTVSELEVALRCLPAIGRRWLSSRERDNKAELAIREDLKDMHSIVSTLKERLRRSQDDAFGGGKRSRKAGRAGSPSRSPSRAGPRSGQVSSGPSSPKAGMGRCQSMPSKLKELKAGKVQTERLPLARRTFQKIKSTLEHIPPGAHLQLEEATLIMLGGYFESATKVIKDQAPYLADIPKKADDHHLVSALKNKAKLTSGL